MSVAMTEKPAVAREPRAGRHALPAIAVTVLVAAALALLVLQPVGIIALNSWRDDLTGQWSLVNYLRIFTTPNLIEPMLNSLVLAGSTAVIATALGAHGVVGVAHGYARARPGPGTGAGGVHHAVFIGALGGYCWRRPTPVGSTSGSGNGWAGIPHEYLLDVGAVFVCAVYTVPFTFTIIPPRSMRWPWSWRMPRPCWEEASCGPCAASPCRWSCLPSWPVSSCRSSRA